MSSLNTQTDTRISRSPLPLPDPVGGGGMAAMTAGRAWVFRRRAVLLILVMVAGVAALAPRAFAQTTSDTEPVDWRADGSHWRALNVLQQRLVGKLMVQQSVTIRSGSGTQWRHSGILACPWPRVTPAPDFSSVTLVGCQTLKQEGSSGPSGTTSVTVTNFVPTQAMIDNGGVVIRVTWALPTPGNFVMTEWVPLLTPPSATLVLTPESISENGGVATVSAKLDRPWFEAVTITVSASAMAPAVTTDFTRSGMTLTFAANTTTSTGTVTLTAVDNAIYAPPKSVTVSGTASDSMSATNAPPDVTLTLTNDDLLPRLVAGEDTTINGHTVTVTSAGEPPTVTVTPSIETGGAIEVMIRLYEGDSNIQLPDGGRRFYLGSSDQPTDRTAVDITVTSEGRPLTDANRARVLGDGLLICLPVSPALQAEARGLGRNLYLLHNRNGEWTIVDNKAVANVEAQGNQFCATLTDFSPFVVAIDKGKEVTFELDVQQLTFLTGQAVREALPAATGDGTITYEWTPTPPLPAGLTYTHPGVGADHGGTITGTPTKPTAQQTYTLTATDGDGDTNSMTLRIEVKPGIQSRDLGLVLAGVGRTLASDAVEILGGRFGSSPASRLQVTLGGQVLRLTTPQSPSPSSPPSPLAGEGQGEGEVLQGEGSMLQGETRAVPVGSSPWQQATGLALSVARALGVNLDTSPSPLAGEGRGEGGILQNETNLPGRLPTDLRRTTTSSPFRLQSVSGKDLLARSAFELPLTRTGDAGVPAWTLWGRGSAAGFSGQPEADFKMDGTLYSGYVGVDYRPQATMLLGLALAHSTGEVNYERTGATKAGADVELTSVLPYAHWQPRPGLGVWGLAGVGWGEMDLKLVGDPQMYTTGLTSWLGAVGGRQALTTWQGIDLAAKTDAFLTTVRSAGKTNLPAARGHAQRVRLLVEGRTAVEVSSVSRLEPRLELGGPVGQRHRGAGPRRGTGWWGRLHADGLGVERGCARAVSAAARGRSV